MQLSIILTALFFSFTLSAGEIKKFYDYSFEVGIASEQWDYREFKNGSELMRDYGQLSGFSLQKHWFYADDNWMFSLGFDYLRGYTSYDGQLQDGTPYKTDSKNSISTLKFLFSKGFSSYTFTIGYSTSLLHNYEMPEEPADYSRKISHGVIPMGFTFFFNPFTNVKLELDICYQLFLDGRVETMLTEVGFDNDLVNEQHKGYGYSFALSFVWPSWKLTLYSHHDNIEDSENSSATKNDKTLIFYEPENTSDSLGIRVSWLL